MGINKYNEVKNIFNTISHKYDFLNSLLSLELHKFWKNHHAFFVKIDH